MRLSTRDRALVRRELASAQEALAAGLETDDALTTLAELTVAVEGLTATQSELVNLLLDRGVSWSELADALATSSAAAKRRYPRRDRHAAQGSTTGAPA